jgi:4'-phosphopantetheinyl transferase
MASSTVSAPAVPGAGVVDLWQVPLAGRIDDDVALLSSPERARLVLRSGASRRRFARSHGALRRIIGGYDGIAPAAVEVYAPYGAPPRVRPGLQVSLAHSDDVALIAVASAQVGVDIEAIAAGEDEDLHELAELTLSDRELERFRSIRPDARPESWVRSWTRKEAWLKAHGRGLGDQALRDVDVTQDSVEQHTLIDLNFADGYVGALALAHPEPRIRWKELQL